MISYIIAAVLGIIGIAGFIGFFVKLKDFLRVRSYGGRAHAEVVGIKEEVVEAGKNQSETYYSPVIQYRAGGVLYRKTFAKMSSLSKQRIGSLIPIRYDTKDPSNFENEKMTDMFLQTFGLLFLGVAMFILIFNVVL